MTNRSLRLGAAALATVAFAACNKPADTPVTDSTNPAAATQSVPAVPTTDSVTKVDSAARKPAMDSAMPMPKTVQPQSLPAKKP